MVQKLLFLFAVLSFNCFAVGSDPLTPEQLVIENIHESSILSSQILNDRHYMAEIGLKTNLGRQEKGFQIGVGRRWEFFGVDVRYSYIESDFDSLRTNEDASQSTGAAWAPVEYGDEESRIRNKLDSWSGFRIEPGLSLEGRLFPNQLPLLTERSRVGVGVGTFHDEANQIDFLTTLFSIEGSLIQQLSAKSRWSITATVSWNSGVASAKIEEPLPRSIDRRLPLNWIDGNFGLMYSF